jgi:hypothetical protein
MVKLTVLHDDFEPGSTAATMVKNGWPVFLSSLKTPYYPKTRSHH